VSSISKTVSEHFFLIELTCDIYNTVVQMEGKISVLGQNFTATDKTKLSEPTKKTVRWLTGSKIYEQIVDSNRDDSESYTVPGQEDEGYEESESQLLLQEAALQIVWYTPMVGRGGGE
jgi:hypothetical protein